MPVDLGTIWVGSLAAIANGALTQSGAITTAATASFTAGANAITITNAANSFGGDVSLSNSGANLASITDTTPLDLGTSSVGPLAAISNGRIVQGGAIAAAGGGSIINKTNAITMTNAAKGFHGAATP